MINQTAIMFTPFPNDPLVKEHGSEHFEVMIPLQDINFAAFTKDVNLPKRWLETVHCSVRAHTCACLQY